MSEDKERIETPSAKLLIFLNKKDKKFHSFCHLLALFFQFLSKKLHLILLFYRFVAVPVFRENA